MVHDKVRVIVDHRNWKEAKIIEKLYNNPRSVIIETADGQVFRRNIGHIHKTQAKIPRSKTITVPTSNSTTSDVIDLPIIAASPIKSPNQSNIETKTILHSPAPLTNQQMTHITTGLKTRAGRLIKQPIKLNL